MKPQVVLDWIKVNGVSAAAWVYSKSPNGYAEYSRGPIGFMLTPLSGRVQDNFFVPSRTWFFVKNRVEVTPPNESSMFMVRA